MEILDLIKRAKAYAKSAGLKVSTVSKKLFNDGKAIDRLSKGGQCTIKTYTAAMKRLDDLEAT